MVKGQYPAHEKRGPGFAFERPSLTHGGAVVQWVRHLDFAISRLRVQILLKATLRNNNLRQVIYTYVPLSPSSITW